MHVNSEFADQADDHDPQVVRLVPWPREAPLAALPRPDGVADWRLTRRR
ncbi:hypothetical protein [Streptomyces sp. R44]|uniref:Uncharacterized protein n=1 Tax=Streptomyces sp. R44 TaxID=3238633 RepID=A0AB39T5W3_9ACTN